MLLVIPVYLLALELSGGETAWLACLLTVANPIVGSIVLNVLSESTFLLWWTFGLWAAVRFLREGRFLWLPLAIGFGALAYLTRPEGMLLPVALAATLLILPAAPRDPDQLAPVVACPRVPGRGARVPGRAVHRAQGGPGNQAADRAGAGIWRPRRSPWPWSARPRFPLARRRSRPTGSRRSGCSRSSATAVTLPLLPFAILGIVMAGRHAARARAALFLAIVLAASAVALVRLHATAGYCTPRHGLVPGILLTLAAAHAITDW